MKDFWFDVLAVPPKLIWWRLLLLLLGGLTLTGVLVHARLQVTPELTMQRQLLRTTLDRMQVPVATPSLKPAELTQAWQRARHVAAQLELPWQQFFGGLGQAGRGGNVAFVSIEPDPEKGRLVLVAEARNLDAMLRFVSALQQHEEFSEVVLQSHAVDKTLPEKPVRFRLTAAWRTAP